jgi:hypothetical protein
MTAGDLLGFGPVGLQTACELPGLDEGQEVSARHLINGDPQAVPNDSALELHREETIVAALQEPGWLRATL